MRGKIYKILILSSLLFFVMLFYAQKAQAANSDVLINEVFPDSKDRTKEFIEFRNVTDRNISLANYTIEDENIEKYFGTTTYKPVVLDKFSMPANSFLVLYGGKIDFSFELNKDNEKVILRNNGAIIDEVDYGTFDGGRESWPTPAQGQSLTRYKITVSDSLSTDFILAMPSPGLEYYKPVYSQDITINEIVPAPSNTSDNELIELYNSGSADINLSYWMLDDGNGGSALYSIPNNTKILAQSYLVFYKSQTNISLNDDGDEARLFSPDNQEKSMIKYDTAKQGMSYSYFVSGWQWTKEITPNAINIFLPISNNIETNINQTDAVIPIEQAKQDKIGDMVSVSGVITAPPDTLSSQYLYIQDNTGGIQVYCYKKDFPMLSKGDKILVKGILSNSSGEERIKIIGQSDISIISHQELIPAKETEINNIGEDLDGQYVKIKGKIVKTSGSTFTVGDDSGHEVKVVIQSMTEIQKPKMRKGDIVEISGIVSQYKNEYRILPIQQNDVKIITSVKLPKAGVGEEIYLIFTFIILSIWNIFQKAKKKLFKLRQ